MTDDHPILSAAVHILPNPGHEELLFVDVDAALRSRHWPNPKELVVDESIFWSMDDVHETLPRKERLQSIEKLPSGYLPANTLVYDVITDSSSYNVDGVFVRSDFPPILAYPQVALLIERLATLAVHHEIIVSIVVNDPKAAQKTICFDEIARELLTALSRFVSDSSIVDSFGQYEASTYAHIDATFVNGEPADVSVAIVDWLSLVSLRFSVFASRILVSTPETSCSISPEKTTVIFVDVTELGNRCLVGLNGRNPHMTDDHPILSFID